MFYVDLFPDKSTVFSFFICHISIVLYIVVLFRSSCTWVFFFLLSIYVVNDKCVIEREHDRDNLVNGRKKQRKKKNDERITKQKEVDREKCFLWR
jgi:hypothetical protein